MKTLLLCLLVTALAGPIVAQTPKVQQLSSLRLHDGFTLVYRVTVQDLRTPALRAAEMQEERQGIELAVQQGHIPPSQKARYLSDAERAYDHVRSTEWFLITLSARDGKLLYRSTRGSTIEQPAVRKVVILDADRAYEADGMMEGAAGAVYNDGFRAGGAYTSENVDRLDFCPLPGVGLPGVDLIQSPVRGKPSPDGHTHFIGGVPRLNTISSESPYRPGEIETASSGGRLKVVSVTVGPRAAPEQRWDIDQYRQLQGHWIGSHMKMTDHDAYETLESEASIKKFAAVPSTVVDYQLIAARNIPLEPSQFDLAAYLAKGATVSDDAGPSSFQFMFDPDKGDLKRQDAEAQPQKPTPDAAQVKP